jgi:MerR family transcriptional regulator, thiopeptide resistance regulator
MATEMQYTVKQLAAMAGVSARTLHYYDEIGLLKPSRNPDNGYRIYTRTSLLRLQQILFLRELGISLEDIQSVLDRPDFDMQHALEQHWMALVARQERLTALIRTVERTLQHMKGSNVMKDQDLFEGFSEEKQKEYEVEAERRWGDTHVKESQKRWGSYSAEKKQAIKEEGKAVYLDLVAAIPLGPSSPQAQSGIARWHQHLRYFYEPDTQVLLGLGDLYNEDPEFNAFFVKLHPDLAAFMREAIQVYCQK